MPKHDQTTAKEYFYHWYKHRKKQCCLILENSIRITKIRIMKWQKDEGGHMNNEKSYNRWISSFY